MQSIQTELDHCLSVLGEECGEVQQALGKINRFGILDINPNTNNPNWVELKKEFHDIVAAYEMVCTSLGQSSEIDRSLINQKKERVNKYMKYAVEQGRLEHTTRHH